MCTNKDCELDGVVLPKIIWQKLIRTRKALDKAKLVLTDLYDHAVLDGIQEWDVYEALKEITALEQKE
jgi:hypothetical protein